MTVLGPHRHRTIHRPSRAEALAPEAGRRLAYVHAGQVFATAEPHTVTTVLGSCVAVCLWSPLSGVGGMNHFQLPLRTTGRIDTPKRGAPSSAPSKFGDAAIACLIRELSELGSPKGQLRAKVFGGACVIAAFAGRENHLGWQNVRLAFEVLGAEGIPIVGSDVGGQRGRKLVFHTNDGTTFVRPI